MPALESSYTRIRELGRGGMGVVTLARQHSLNRLVAIKELLFDGGDADGLIKRFAREAAALAKLSHPNVVRLLDFDLAHEPPYLVCEYVEHAVPLMALMQEEPPGREAALGIALEIADALAHIHAGGLMHRDLKPANVLIDGDDHARVIDFGLARAVTAEESRLTQTGDLIGTFTYMAPEQMAGKEADARADVYAFGLMLYELLAGKLVFAAVASRPVAPGQRSMGRIPPLAGVTPELAAIVERCLELEPGKRFADGAELLAALAPVARPAPATEPVTAPPTVRSVVDDPPESRAALGLAVAAATLIGIAIGLGAWARPAPPAVRPELAVMPEADDALLDLARDAAEIEPRAVVAEGKKRLRTRAELAALRAEALSRFARLLDRSAAVLDAEDASLDAKRILYLGLARLRLLDRVLELNGLPGLSMDRALGRTFAPGVPAGLDLLRHELGLAPDVVKFRQVGVELTQLMKDIIEVATEGRERVRVDLSSPPSALKWAALHLRTPRLGRRDILWVTINDLPLMLDDRCVAAREGTDCVISHFVDPRLLRMTGNTIAVAHEPLPGEGSASILRLSTQVGIAGSVRPLAP